MSCVYIADSAKLADILGCLEVHESEVRTFFHADLAPRLLPIVDPRERLAALFAISNSDRRAKGRAGADFKSATAAFFQHLTPEKTSYYQSLPASQAHEEMMAFLCGLSGMDQKTANLFLKFAAMFATDFSLCGPHWSTWTPHLHVPLDLWVLRLLGASWFGVATPEFEEHFAGKDGSYSSPGYDGYRSNRYHQLQMEIAEVAASRASTPITLDLLWFVGAKFCNVRPVLCDACWLRDQGCNSCQSFKPDVLPPGPDKAERKAQQKAEKQKLVKAARQWGAAVIQAFREDYPDRDPSEVWAFCDTPEGKAWRDQRVRIEFKT